MKAKRFLSTVLSVCLAVLTLFSFVGCGKKDPVKEALSTGEKIPYIDRTMVFKDKIFGFKNEIVKVVRSRAELVSAIHEANFSWKKETETWSEYNDDFFQYSALIVCLKYMGSSSIQREFAGITVQKKQLFIFFTSHFEGNNMNDDSKPYYYFLEVKQDTVKAVEEIKIEFIEI